MTSLQGAVLVSSLFHFLLFFGGGLEPFRTSGTLESSPHELEVFYAHPSLLESIPMQSASEETEAFIEEDRFREEMAATQPISMDQKEQLMQEKSTLEEAPSSDEAFMTELHLTQEEKPLYLAYYQAIREKIRRSVYAHYPRELKDGQVALRFVLFSNGKLKEAGATQHRSFKDRRLKEIVLRSLIDASPFPSFPEGLERPFVPFRVMITFVDEQSFVTGES